MQAYGTKIGFAHFAEAGAENRVRCTTNVGIANPAGRIHKILPDPLISNQSLDNSGKFVLPSVVGDPDPLFRGTDPRIRMDPKLHQYRMSRIPNTASQLSSSKLLISGNSCFLRGPWNVKKIKSLATVLSYTLKFVNYRWPSFRAGSEVRNGINWILECHICTSIRGCRCCHEMLNAQFFLHPLFVPRNPGYPNLTIYKVDCVPTSAYSSTVLNRHWGNLYNLTVCTVGT